MSNFTVKNVGGKMKYTCACGSEMWDNTKNKKNPKAPDLKCKNTECTEGKNDTPNAVWLKQDEKDKLTKEVKKQESNNVSFKGGVKIGTSMEVSYYGAWAKDMALYLAEKNGVKNPRDLNQYYSDCLEIVGDCLSKHLKQISVGNVSQDVSNNTETVGGDIDISNNFGEPEDITDVNSEEKVNKNESSDIDEMDFSGLDDVDIS